MNVNGLCVRVDDFVWVMGIISRYVRGLCVPMGCVRMLCFHDLYTCTDDLCVSNGFARVHSCFAFYPYVNDLCFSPPPPLLFQNYLLCFHVFSLFYVLAGLAAVYRGRSAFLDGHRKIG